MKPGICNFLVASALICSLLLVSESAWALRCGNRLVKEGMYAAQVIEICGDPVATQQLGYVFRPYVQRRPASAGGLHATQYVYGGYHQGLVVTEMLFNFGPHKLMRIIRFEDGQVASIKTVGYGYHGKSK
jgi:hypothetical protein